MFKRKRRGLIFYNFALFEVPSSFVGDSDLFFNLKLMEKLNLVFWDKKIQFAKEQTILWVIEREREKEKTK